MVFGAKAGVFVGPDTEFDVETVDVCGRFTVPLMGTVSRSGRGGTAKTPLLEEPILEAVRLSSIHVATNVKGSIGNGVSRHRVVSMPDHAMKNLQLAVE